MTTYTLPPARAGPSRPVKYEVWQPLPYIHSGFAIHPYRPSLSPPSSPNNPRTLRSSISAGAKAQGGKTNPYGIPLDIGDEFFAFEEYRCSPNVDGTGDIWYRGYVVQSVSLPSISPPSNTTASISAMYPKPEPSVLIGIFPSSCIHIRPDESADDGSLAAAYEKAIAKAQNSDNATPPTWGESMEAVKEEEEDEEGYKVGSAKSTTDDLDVIDIPSTAPVENRRSSLADRSKRPKSLILEKLENTDEDKDQPPLPRLTAGDSTIAGQQYPLVDEIACAIREWYTRLPTYLANREYRLFSTVTQHIDALLLGRRQLLSQMLSVDELTRVRRECVSRLAKCNVAQGLDIIVRSLEDGSVVVFEKDKAYVGASWASGIACYAQQIQLAYIDVSPLDHLAGKSPGFVALPSSTSQARLPIIPSTDTASISQPYYHLVLDIHAFIANPCRPGETAELYFSLYNQAEGRFITEEFCLVLNHLGSPARDSEQRLGRLRTIFTNLKPEDLGNSVSLVCRLIRNGALKMRGDTQSGHRDNNRGSSIRRPNGYFYSDMSTSLSTQSIAESATDDSFSAASGFGGHRTRTGETSVTTSESIVDGRPTFRRPFGCAAVSPPSLTKLTSENTPGTEVSMPIFAPKEEATFATLHEDVIAQKTSQFYVSSRAESIAVSLKAFHGPTQQVIKQHPSLLHDVPPTARLGFPDVVAPGERRNDIYIKLWSASFITVPSAASSSMRALKSIAPLNSGNVQITVEVRRQDGTVIADALFAGGSGEPAVAFYHSLVFSNTDKPTFGELLKVSLPPDTDDCHLFLTFRSRNRDRGSQADAHELERPFAFAYLPLISSSTCIKDGSHDMVLYRMEKNLQPAPHIYFEAPPLDRQDTTLSSSAARNMSPLRDRLSIRTYLCSTVHTQDDTLKALFRYQATDPDSMVSALQMFSFIPEEELSKFVTQIFDSLFGIMVSNLGERQDELDDLIFKALTKVLSMNADRRYPGFNTVLTQYLSSHFRHPASSFHLLRSMKVVMAFPETKEYRSFLKVWHLLFRFIIRSRELDRARGVGLDPTSKHIEADFQQQTKAILSDFNALMMSSDKSLIGSQTLAVQHYADILPDLAQVFAPLELVELVIAFADTLTFAKGSIASYKLVLLLQIVKNLFDTAEARALLVPTIVKWVKPHLGRYERIYESMDPKTSNKGQDGAKEADLRHVKWLERNRLAVTVVAWTIDKLQEWFNSPLIAEERTLLTQEEDNLEYCLTLLPTLLDSYIELASSDTLSTVNRQRLMSTSILRTSPDVFPTSHPIALIAELPPPSLLDKRAIAEDGLPTSETFICSTVEISVVIFTLILSAPRRHILRWLTELVEIEGSATLSAILKRTFDFCSRTIKNEAFPSQWLTLKLLSMGSMVRLLDPVAEVFEAAFIPPFNETSQFDIDLWRGVFELLCDFCGNEQLSLEDMTQQRRRAQWIVAGDLRDEGAALLLRLWNAMGWEEGQKGGIKHGGYQTRFTGLAGRILGLCLSNHDGICEAAVEILYSMIYAEYILKGRFGGIQSEIFAKLDELFVSKEGVTSSVSDPASRAYFVAQLRAVFESSTPIDTAFVTEVGRFMDEIELFIDLLITLRTLPQSVEWKDERCLALFRLMEFTKRIGRQDLYVRFTFQLVTLAMEAKDLLAAGYGVKLLAEAYTWTTGADLVKDFPEMGLPLQSQFERKEALLYHVMDHFAEAEAYEAALEVCQELTRWHERLTYDIPKLKSLLLHQAGLWEKISTTQRPKPEYFRVAYFGEVEMINKGKDYVVRGRPWERYSDFCETIQLKHPTAMIHRSKIPPPEAIRHGLEPVIWVTSLIPEPDLSSPVFSDKVAENVQNYRRWNNVKRFSSTRPYARDGGEAEAVLSWTEKTIITVMHTLPGVLCRSEVIDIVYEQISPLGNALIEIERATKTLSNLSKGEVDVKQLGNAINGAVDSPVNGGVKLYRNVFLDPEYNEKHPQDADQVAELRRAISNYAGTISEALAVHRSVCRDFAFHEALRSHFQRAFPEEIAVLPHGIDPSALHAPLPPLPEMNGSDHLRLPSNAARDSTYSIGSAAYVLPALRLGPSPTPSLLATPATPPGRRTPSVPVTAGSSPRLSMISGRRVSSGTISHQESLTVPPIERALSAVGSAKESERSRDSISATSEGTIGGFPRQSNGNGSIEDREGKSGASGRKGSTSRKGLQRLSSLMRR